MTVRPYPPGTQWRFQSRQSGYEKTQELVLYAEPNGSSLTDDYLPSEITPRELWRQWVTQMADHAYTRWPDQYRPGEVTILWTVTTPQFRDTFERAPHTLESLVLYSELGDLPRKDFLTFYTHPEHAETGERVNWLRLPVMDLGWNSRQSDKGGFIQEATGWKPSPLQDRLNVRQLGRAAGLYVPEPRTATRGA